MAGAAEEFRMGFSWCNWMHPRIWVVQLDACPERTLSNLLHVRCMCIILRKCLKILMEKLMRFIKKLAPYDYTKMDNKVLSTDKLTDGAKLMYLTLCGLHPDTEVTDKFLRTKMGKSQRTIISHKKELRDFGLLCTLRTSMRGYTLYLGNSHQSAKHVMKEHQRQVKEAHDADTSA